jgi:exosome complex exonuclease RRP6
MHKEEEEGDVEEEMGMLVEIPFVPAAQRQAAIVIEEKERRLSLFCWETEDEKAKENKEYCSPE